ncbi:hypothetical protein NQ318_008757, partial [Aromia moschata]
MLSVQMEQRVNLKFLVKLAKTFIKIGLLNMVTLKGTIFQSVEVVKAKSMEILYQLTEADFQHCFQQWKSRMERCRDRQEECIEGENVATVMTAVRLDTTKY